MADVLAYAHQVARGARRLMRLRLPPAVQRPDLEQAAWVRLLALRPSAIDAGRSAAHQEAYVATHVRGAMIDYLRDMDPVLHAAGTAHDAEADPDDQLAQLPAPDEDQPQHAAERAQSLRLLHAAVCALPHPLRLVVLHQLAEVPAQTTAATLRVDPSRVSQLRADALHRLRLRLAAPFGIRR